jgi:membrane associated rhomboid family serine protease
MPPILRQAPATLLVCLAAIGFTALYQADRGVELVGMRYTAFSTEPYRLLSSTLVHGGILHLVFNLYWTWTFGRVIEERLGSLVVSALYLALACGSGAAQYAVGDGGIGLSGVGYGFFALLWIVQRKEPAFGEVVTPGITRLFVIWFFICIFLSRTGMMPIANTAHGIGAVLGLVAGWLLTSPARSQKLRTAVMALSLSLCFVAATVARPAIAPDHGRFFELQDKASDAFDDERFEDALLFSREIVELRPEYAGGWFNLGLSLDRTGDHASALEAFERAARMDPGNEKFQSVLRR